MKHQELSTEQLEELLKERKAEETAAAQAAKEAYEKKKESLINSMGIKACELTSELAAAKTLFFTELENFRSTLLAYGEIKGGENNKGNFELKNQNFKVQFSSALKKEFDERAELAEEKLKSFLQGFVKKRDQKLYKVILGLLERNSVTGQLDINNINRLYKLENEFDDENWHDCIRLFKEAYNPTTTSRYIRIYKANPNNGWDLLNLNFSSI